MDVPVHADGPTGDDVCHTKDSLASATIHVPLDSGEA